jgi:hypothetical protein
MSAIPARGNRHPMTVVTKARHLAEGGWRPFEIVRLLAEDGIHVHASSVQMWVDPTVAEKRRRRGIERRRRDATRRSGRLAHFVTNATDEFKLVRMRALRERGLGANAIAKVMTFDFEETLTQRQVEYALKTGRYPKIAKAAA